ncbi:MAG: uncharacterized protein A8A55_0273 [Amphiamblys sp. WSBS2006]|nr:MAG: uncharacterized protein A8A55_0273 [Amphiamblys sp. WSBS2006]
MLSLPALVEYQGIYISESEDGLLITKEKVSVYKEIRRYLYGKKHEDFQATGNKECVGCGAQFPRHKTYKEQSMVLLAAVCSGEDVLLTKDTLVILEDIAISDKLFFMLLAKTRIKVGSAFSVFGHERSKDVVKKSSTAEDNPVSLVRKWISKKETELELIAENIRNIPPRTIGCACREFVLHGSPLSGLLPKLKTKEDNEMETLELLDLWEDNTLWSHVGNRSIDLGTVRNIRLENSTANVLPKLKIRKDNEMESFFLSARSEQEISEIVSITWIEKTRWILGLEQAGETKARSSIYIGKVKQLTLLNYGVNVLPFLKLHGDNEIENLVLSTYGEVYIIEIFCPEERSVCLGRVREKGFRVSEKIKHKLDCILVEEAKSGLLD